MAAASCPARETNDPPPLRRQPARLRRDAIFNKVPYSETPLFHGRKSS